MAPYGTGLSDHTLNTAPEGPDYTASLMTGICDSPDSDIYSLSMEIDNASPSPVLNFPTTPSSTANSQADLNHHYDECDQTGYTVVYDTLNSMVAGSDPETLSREIPFNQGTANTTCSPQLTTTVNIWTEHVQDSKPARLIDHADHADRHNWWIKSTPLDVRVANLYEQPPLLPFAIQGSTGNEQTEQITFGFPTPPPEITEETEKNNGPLTDANNVNGLIQHDGEVENEQTGSTLEANSVDEEWPCEYKKCDKVFPKKYLRNKHYNVHKRPHACPWCEKRFAVRRDKERHISDRHRKESGMSAVAFFCAVETCKRSFEQPFTRRDNMLRHVRIQHPGDREALAAAKAEQGVLAEGHNLYGGQLEVIIGEVEEVDDDEC